MARLITKCLLSSLLLLMLSVKTALAQDFPVDNIERAMKTGNASAIAAYFGSSIDITINNSQSNYSVAQGQLVLSDFFRKNHIKDFSFKRIGNPAGNNKAVYAIGRLTTKSGEFKVYFYLKQVNNQPLLQQIRIEK